MERFEEEHTYKTTYYKAWDGNVFSSEKECIEYEKTPAVIAWKNVQGFLVRKFSEYKLAPTFIESDRASYVFKPTRHCEITALNEFLKIDRWGIVRKSETLDDSYIGKVIFVYGDYSWNASTIDEMVDEFRKRLEYIISDDETDIDYDDDEERIIRNSRR